MPKLKIDSLKPAPYNPRKISEEAASGLKVSLDEFGDLSCFVWNRHSGNMVAGHQRLEQLKKAFGDKLKIEGDGKVEGDNFIETPDGRRFFLRIVNWKDGNLEKAANITANNPNIQGEFDDGLEDILASLEKDSEELFNLLNLDEIEIPNIFGEPETNEGLTDPDAIPEEPPESLSKTGDLWILGNHRLLCGDCTKAEDVERVMGGEKALVMATDPPYGVSYDNAKRPNPGVAKPRVAKPRVANDEIVDGPAMQAFLESMLRAALPNMDPHAAFYFWHPMLTQGTYVAAAAAAAGILIHRQIIWVKPGLLLGRGDYHWRHELCFYGWQKGNRPPFYGPRNQDTIWEVGNITNADRKEYNHPTPKPVDLWSKPILNHSKKGEVIFEPFCGSGPTIIAAEQLNRRCFAIEIEPRYVDVAVARWEQFTGKEAKRT